MKRGAPWTKIEEEFLRDNMHLTYAEVARKLGRPEGGVAEKARRLGLAKRIHKDWSREELSKLRRIYPYKRNKELGEIFGVSEDAIVAKAAVMGLYKKGRKRREKRKPAPPKPERVFPERLREPLIDFVCEVIAGSPRLQQTLQRRINF